MILKKLYFIVGETASGKDTVTKMVANDLNQKIVCSFTSRKMRKGEIDGREHHFVTREEIDIMFKEDTMLAYTEIGAYAYGATVENLGDARFYIINPDGIRWFEAHKQDINLDVVTIYITAPYTIRKQRSLARNDNLEAFDARVMAENNDFINFREDYKFDYIFQNYDSTKTASAIKKLIEVEES